MSDKKTRYERAAALLGLGPKDDFPTLPQLVLDARQSCNGAADPWSIEKLSAVRQVLQMRFDEWYPSADPIDHAVRMMVFSGIELLDREIASRVGEVASE